MINEKNQASADFERQKFAHEVLRKEIEYRRHKAWAIFSWASTILLGAIGGVIAIAGKSDLRLPWFPHRALLVGAVVVLATYACLWIRQNLGIEQSVSEKLEEYETALGIRTAFDKYSRRPRFGYTVTLILLTTAAILAVLLVPLSSRSEAPTAQRIPPLTPPSTKELPWTQDNAPSKAEEAVAWVGVQERLLSYGYNQSQIQEIYNLYVAQRTANNKAEDQELEFLPGNRILVDLLPGSTDKK